MRAWSFFISAFCAAAMVAAGPMASAKAPSDWSLCKASSKKNVSDSAKVEHCTAVIDAAAKGDKKASKHLASAYFHRGVAYNGMDQHDKALADLSQAVQLDPKSSKAWYQRGNVYSDKGSFDQAIGDYDHALQLKPKHARALANRCRARGLANKDLAQALADCNGSLALKRKGNGRALSARGLTQFRTGAWAKALADLDAAAPLLPKAASVLFVRGLVKLKMGDAAGGNADIAAAKTLEADIAAKYAVFGIAP